MGFGQFLKEQLEKEKKSVYQLSKETGIPKTTIYGIISRDSTPNLYTMLSLVACLPSVTPLMFDEFLDSQNEKVWHLNSEKATPKVKNNAETISLMLNLAAIKDIHVNSMETAEKLMKRIEEERIVLEDEDIEKVVAYANYLLMQRGIIKSTFDDFSGYKVIDNNSIEIIPKNNE